MHNIGDENKMEKIFDRPHSLSDVVLSYCPGCTHGVINRLIAEVVDEMGLEGKTIGVCPVGCSVTAYNFFEFDMQEASHGRAPAVATGIKRVHPENLVFTYQGDGDLAAIGTAETIHSAARAENITIIFVNNTIYGMTGGQMAPTSLVNQVTQTTPFGRKVENQGYPIQVSEMVSTLRGACYVERVSVDNVPNIKKTKAAIRKAFECQMAGLGFSLVEVLSTCPTNWGMSPVEALERVRTEMMPEFPLGVYKDCTKTGGVR